MDVFVARQAVFNKHNQVVAYELLFRDSAENSFPDVEDKVATAKLICDSQLNQGLSYITGGRKALVNFGEQSLREGLADFLPIDKVVIEILENVPPDDSNYQLVNELFHKGYRLALDDFKYEPRWEKFLKLVRLIKFDLQHTSFDEIDQMMELLQKYPKIKYLAEKVETQSEYEQAKQRGFEFFQGYFFAKPQMVSQKDCASRSPLVMAIYAQALKPQLNISELAQIFSQDTGLTYKLLRFINSGLFPLQERMDSIKQALVYLGEERVRRFVSLIVTAHISHDKPLELTRLASIRARFCELVAKRYFPASSNSAFLVGLFSLVDAMLDRRMDKIVETLPFPDEIAQALLGENNTLYYILELVKAYESGSWWAMQRACEPLNITDKELPNMHKSAITWSQMFDTL
ncbi:EAL and HDOD domain-containing protein [Pseudoalteromonas sp. SSDWG2]|uniref:EAL and HDOD domain-containing protein n=1 Tax=Pseudoalteromonas sp. SSDWG2 TaxID=3139391 RepID=UPI003BACF7E1